MAAGNVYFGSKILEAGILWKVHVALVVVQLGYGGSYVLNKVALTNGVNPIVFAVYRDVICLIVLIPVAVFAEREKRRPFTYETIMLLIASGFFGAFLTQMLSLYGTMLTSAAYASTLSVLTPLFTFIISTSCGFEKIRWKRADGLAKLGGLISALFGAVVLAIYLGPVVIGHLNSGVSGSQISSSDPDTRALAADTLLHAFLGPWHLGILLLFIAGFTLSLSISIQAPLTSRYPAPMSASACGYGIGAVMLLTTALFTVKDWSDLVITERSAVISYVYNEPVVPGKIIAMCSVACVQGLVPAAFNYTTLIWCVQKAGPVLVGSYVPLQLFTAAALAYIFLGESIHLGSILGTLLIINGLGFITWGQVKSRTEDGVPLKNASSMNGLPITAAAQGLEEPLLS